LPTSPVYCGRTTLKSAKSHFSTMLFICASECLGYYRIKWITTVIMHLSGRSLLIESIRSDLLLRGHNYGVCHTTVRSPHPRCSAGIQSTPCLNQPLQQLDHNSHSGVGYTLMHHAQDAIIHNLGQDCCRMATCYGLNNSLKN